MCRRGAVEGGRTSPRITPGTRVGFGSELRRNVVNSLGLDGSPVVGIVALMGCAEL